MTLQTHTHIATLLRMKREPARKVISGVGG